jgi:glycosyltransferase involved in cell wall biosynthesis
MRIAILGSVALPIPPPAQGGAEWIAYYQVKELAKRGHSIILFAAKGSRANFSEKNIKVIEIGKGDVVAGSNRNKIDLRFVEASREMRLEATYLSEAMEKMMELKDEYDIILNNMRGEAVLLPIAKILGKPFVNVMHLNLFPELAQVFRSYNTNIITISNSQRKDFPDLNYAATVYNCVDTEKFSFDPNPEDYMLMVGTIGRHKNQSEAVNVAKELNMKLVLAGKVRDQSYLKEFEKDIDGGQIKWLGEIGFEEKLKVYEKAKVFLFPISWEEPFGLVMIEAMACGTPIVVYNRGSVSELVRDGVTGFVIEPEDSPNESKFIIKKKGREGLKEAVRRIGEIDRKACRENVLQNFTVQKMADGYEKVCKDILNK